MRKTKRNNWFLAILLSLPILAFFAAYLMNHSGRLIPTGFIQLDNISYIAYARQYLDDASLHFFYSNPYDAGAPLIYFQPQTFFFALLLKLGIPPGFILIPFTVTCSVICFRIVISIYDHLINESTFRILHIVLFAWGGGLLAISGLLSGPFQYTEGSLWQNMFLLDPEGGWWGLNLGRSLLFSCEAYYHALFLGIIYLLMKRSWLPALVLMFLLSLSHPFTGLEILGIVCFWMLVELFWNRKEFPVGFAAGCLVLLAFHFYYYLYHLEQFPHHRSVREQYSLTWGLRYYRMLPAYVLVGSLALAAILRLRASTYFASAHHRLFASWFVVAFLLANHEWFIAPRQPIHFTRGYIWTSLFLLGLPALTSLTSWLKMKWGKSALAILALVFLSDNLLWFTQQVLPASNNPSYRYLTAEQKSIFHLIKNLSTPNTIVITNDRALGNLTPVYTIAVPWYSHPFTTPFAQKKREAQENLLLNGKMDSAWQNHTLMIVLTREEVSAAKVYDSSYKMFPYKWVYPFENYTIIRLAGSDK